MEYWAMDVEVGSKGQPQLYNIKAVVNQTGLNPATIRAWERRYGFPQPKRTDGGHRQYSQRDIDTLKWLISRQEEGVSISHAIDLWRARIQRGEDPLAEEALIIEEQAVPVTVPVAGEKLDEIRQAWITSCLFFDREAAEQILARAFALFPPETVCLEIMQKGLAEVGGGWYDGEVTVQQEHFASALSVHRLEMLIAAAPPPSRPEKVIVTTAPGDYHIFSPLLLTYMLRNRGWDVIYLGANVPADELEETIKQVQPGLVIFSAQLLHTAANLAEIAQSIQAQEVVFAYGGLVFNQNPSLRQRIPGHFLGQTLEGSVKKVTDLLANPDPALSYRAPAEDYRLAMNQFIEKRALIESHVWLVMLAAKKDTNVLTDVNSDIAETIQAALKLGDINLLNPDFDWLRFLLMGYRLPESWLLDYVNAYHQALSLHMDDPGKLLVDWISKVQSNILE